MEVDVRRLRDGHYVAHPEFMSVSGDSKRACNDCTASGWNDTWASSEKLQLGGTDDVADYGTRLLLQDPTCHPQLAVADEESAYRNWPNDCPDAMIMLVFMGLGKVRAFKDFALCFGDGAGVYAYNRIRLFLTTFFRVCFGMAVWNYFDDSAIVERKVGANFVWYIFLKIHARLGIPLKGNPLAGNSDAGRKFFPPADRNPYLGEDVYVASLPCCIAPTAARVDKANTLLDACISSRRLAQSLVPSVFGKLRFLAADLYGRCGLPALQALSAHEHSCTPRLSNACVSGLEWLREIIPNVGPRQWQVQQGRFSSYIFGDASDPGSNARYNPSIGLVFREAANSKLRTVQVVVPIGILQQLPCGTGRIYYLELLWPAVAAYVWRQDLACSNCVFYEDNEGAKFNLRRGFSKDFVSSLFLAMFWGAAAAQRSVPWIDRVASEDNPADCLTKPGVCQQHLQGALREQSSVLDPLWDFLMHHLDKRRFPTWVELSQLMRPSYQ